MQELENINDHFDTEGDFNFRKIFTILLNTWYLFLIFGFIGLFGAYVLNRYTQSNYKVNATIFVPQKASGVGAGIQDLFNNQLGNLNVGIFNQIEIIKSFNFNYQIVQNLNWRISWYKKDKFSWDNLHKKGFFEWRAYYKDEPFHIIEKAGAYNRMGIQLFMKPINDRQYELKAEGRISFDTICNYGQLFENDHFHFTISPNKKYNELIGQEYYFTFNKTSDIVRAYQNKLRVSLKDRQSDIILLELEGNQPAREIDYLNEVISVYMQYKMDLQTETHKRSLQFIDSQLIGISDSLDSAGSNFSKFRAQNRIVDIGAQGAQVMSSLLNIETEMNTSQRQLDYLHNLLGYIEKSADQKQLYAPSIVDIPDASINARVIYLSELYSRREVLAYSAKENNPTIVRIDQEIAQTTALLKENLKNLIENAEIQKKSLESQKSKIDAQLNRLPEKEQSLIKFQHRFEMTNEIYTFLLQKRAEIDITLAGTSPNVHIIDAARMETIQKTGSALMPKLLTGLLIGLTFPAFFLIIFYYFSNTIESQEDIEKATKLPVLGNVFHSHTISETVVYDNPRSGIAESYRGIRTNLQFMLSDNDTKIIAIHSTHAGEGKSFTAVNLSTILAMNNKKVILIGADLRKPTGHKVLNLSNDLGLTTFLSGQNQLKEIIFETHIENLYFVPSGPIPPNPSELLDKPELSEMIQTLGSQYDYVVIDNAPVAIVTDGLLASRHADLNLFVLRYGYSKKDQIKLINQLDENKTLNHMALIVNDIKTSSFSYGSNYYYSYKYSNYGSGYYEETEARPWFKRIFKRS